MSQLAYKESYPNKSLLKHPIGCVIVFFEPKDDAILTVQNLVSNNYHVIAVINKVSRSINIKLRCVPGLHIIQNKENLGLATGLNQGAAYAFDVLKLKYAIFFDQDSVPNDSLPQMLMEEFESKSNENLACISPSLIDKKSKNLQPNNQKLITAPTSGTLIPISAWKKIGPMLDGLFIDCIDHEWCFRALNQGYKIEISSDIKMLHNMGDLGIHIMGSYKPIYESPLRHYYIVRNTLLLFSYKHVPKEWLIIEILKLIPRVLFYFYFSKNKIKTLKLVLMAIKDGICGKTGRCLG